MDQGLIRNCEKRTSGGWGFRSSLVAIVRRAIIDWYLSKLNVGLIASSDQPLVILEVLIFVRVSTGAWGTGSTGGTDIALHFASTNDYIFTIGPGVLQGEFLKL